jgi:hypothetical protein
MQHSPQPSALCASRLPAYPPPHPNRNRYRKQNHHPALAQHSRTVRDDLRVVRGHRGNNPLNPGSCKKQLSQSCSYPCPHTTSGSPAQTAPPLTPSSCRAAALRSLLSPLSLRPALGSQEPSALCSYRPPHRTPDTTPLPCPPQSRHQSHGHQQQSLLTPAHCYPLGPSTRRSQISLQYATSPRGQPPNATPEHTQSTPSRVTVFFIASILPCPSRMI